jgi:hypothetical protein
MDAILGIITRHPMRQEELEQALARWAPGQVEGSLADLQASGRAQVVERFGVRFWSAAPSYFPKQSQSQASAPERMSSRRHNPPS